MLAPHDDFIQIPRSWRISRWVATYEKYNELLCSSDHINLKHLILIDFTTHSIKHKYSITYNEIKELAEEPIRSNGFQHIAIKDISPIMKDIHPLISKRNCRLKKNIN